MNNHSTNKQLHKVVRITMVAILVLTGLVIMVPLAFSYLSDTQEKGIAIRAASAAELWEMQGSFDVNRWKADNHTGINVHNKSPRDLWIFFEFTGDMKQVFKQSGPVLVKAGETCPVILRSLDEEDSPRVPNPLDLIEFQSDTSGKVSGDACLPPFYGQWQWKTFAGNVKIHTLNSYATLEFPAQVSGSVLWDIYFSNCCGMTALELSASCADASEVRLMTADVGMTKSLAAEELDDSSADSILQSARDYLTRLQSFQPLQFIAPVQAAVERIAPGLWQEREDQQAKLNQGTETIQRLLHMVETLTLEKQQLEYQLEQSQYTIRELHNQLESTQAASATVNGPEKDEPTSPVEGESANIDEISNSTVIEPSVVNSPDAKAVSDALPLQTEPNPSSTDNEANSLDELGGAAQ